MRIHLKTTPTSEIIPFNYLQFLTGALHNWIGQNTEHDNVSLYSFSMLGNAKKEKNGFSFTNGSSFFISAYDIEFLKKITTGIMNNPEICFGLKVKEMIIQKDPDFSNIEFFKIAGPILLKHQMENGKIKHFEFKEPETTTLLTDKLKHKMKIAGLVDDTVSVEFAKEYSKAKMKVIYYNAIGNKANWCPVIIKGKPETKAFAWNVGIGNSTGIGFGSLI
jgi:CRISPR-associated endoribonuclease Cas6